MRSLSAHGYVGYETDGIVSPGYRIFRKSSDITTPPPSQLWVFIDERPDPLNDGFVAVFMDGFQPRNPRLWTIGNLPATFHGDVGGLAFANGHAEIHRWRDPRTLTPTCP